MTDQPTTMYFGARVDHYSAARPDYPDVAMQAVVARGGSSRRIADVGCGTGISSRGLARAGATVIGIDPSPPMLERARADSPPELHIDYRVGTGEATGLRNDDVDVVTCAQSFHWFDRDRALAEFARILRPGGWLALVWNVRTRDLNPFTQIYNEVVRDAQTDAAERGVVVRATRAADPAASSWFEASETLVFDNPHRITADAVIERLRSCSYAPPPGPVRERLEGRLRDAAARHAVHGLVTFSQQTEVTFARVSAGA
jgi:SAM-dependent methyltransferase